MRYDAVEMSVIHLKVCWQTPLDAILEIGMDCFFRVHLVFELLVLLFLKEIPLVPGYNRRVRDHPVCM